MKKYYRTIAMFVFLLVLGATLSGCSSSLEREIKKASKNINEYKINLENLFGADSCHILKIRPVGGIKII